MKLYSLAVLTLMAGCAVSPYQNQLLTTTTVPFDGMATAESANVIVEAYNWAAGTYEWRGATVAAPTPTLGAGVFCGNSPAFYRYKLNVSLNSKFWKTEGKRQVAKLRATQLKNGNSQALYFTDSSNGANCVTDNSTSSGCDFYDVAYNQCHFNRTEVTIRR